MSAHTVAGAHAPEDPGPTAERVGDVAGGAVVTRLADGRRAAVPADHPPTAHPGERRNRVQAVDRVFAVLRCFDAANPIPSASDIARTTGLDRATARRYLITLERAGYVGHSGQRYHLRPRILELGYAYLSSLTLPQIARSPLAKLARRIGESCAVTVLDDTEIAYVAVQNAAQGLSIMLTVGNRLPAYCTAMGRVLLADLDGDTVRSLLGRGGHPSHTATTIRTTDRLLDEITQTGRRGWAIVDQELEPGVRTVAIPIRDRARTAIAAASVSTPSSRVAIEQLEGPIRQALAATTTEIEGLLCD